ncbi:LysR family transcriptional regulator [Pokkaliibacter sp. MBI-7]|uniref:LysR family transcriptional regulator n=1 Tax=Pokkaliibacter sp. MBI-7 TaxID=3040600 RepID=UPI00244A141D|nr:LysR family transcriptional regulator [Pokkaliibacter sp. MBI-7]MDH2433755.1 LysR family transcriptional regulator [Pokkaliibacter sp. MBI-7]
MRSGINLQRVAVFCETVRQGSVRAAADILNVAPSVVSRHIAQLEKELGMALMERHRRGVKVTEAGLRVLQFQQEQLAQEEALFSELQSLNGLHQGQVRLVVGEGFVSDLMSAPLTSFRQRYPGLSFSVRLAGTNEVLREILDDSAHIGLVYYPPADPHIRVHARVPQPLCVIVPAGHPLCDAPPPLTMAQLQSYALAVMEDAYGTRHLLQRAEQEAQIHFQPCLTTNSISVLRRFVLEGMGLAFLPAFSIASELSSGELLALPVASKVLQEAEAQLITRLGRQLPPGAQRLLQHLVRSMGAFSGGQ